MWKDGFSVDGGPLRRYDDPANKQFLDEITQGRLPMELRALGTEVNVSMEDRRKDDYEENKPKQEFKVCLYSCPNFKIAFAVFCRQRKSPRIINRRPKFEFNRPSRTRSNCFNC